MTAESKKDVQAIFRDAPVDIQRLVSSVIDLEHLNIHYKRPPRIKEEIVDIVKEVIK
ncbi:MAG: hypothetical protein PHO65_08730 [Sulfurovum sp.]|nr:hypothetical protein [Sulfurovum sp.]